MSLDIRSFVKNLTLTLLMLFLASVVFSVVILVPLNKNMSEEKKKIKVVLIQSLNEAHRKKRLLLKRRPPKKYTFASVLSDNVFLNIVHTLRSSMGLVELQIGMRSHQNFKGCDEYIFQLLHKGKLVRPYKHLSHYSQKHLNWLKNSILEQFVDWQFVFDNSNNLQKAENTISIETVRKNSSLYTLLARTPSTPQSMLKKLLLTNHRGILIALIENTNLSIDILKLLAIRLTSDYQIKRIINNRNSDLAVLKILLQRANPNIDQVLAGHPATPPEILSSIAMRYQNSRYNVRTRLFIALHAATPLRTLLKLLKSSNPYIRQMALLNKSIPRYMLERQLLLVAPERYYSLAMNPNAGNKLLLKLIQRAHLLKTPAWAARNREIKRVVSGIVSMLRATPVKSDLKYYKIIALSRPLRKLDSQIVINYFEAKQLSPREILLLLIAVHPNAGSSVLNKLHQQSLFAIDNLISRHRNTSDILFEKIFLKRHWSPYRYWRGGTKPISSKANRVLSKKLAVARHNIILGNLVSRNNLKSKSILKLRNTLVMNATPDTAASIISRLKLTTEQYQQLLKIKYSSKIQLKLLRKNLAVNPHIPNSIILTLIKTRSTNVLARLAQRKKLSEEVQQQILHYTQSPTVLELLAKRENLSVVTQEKIAIAVVNILKLKGKKSYWGLNRLYESITHLLRKKSTVNSVIEKIVKINKPGINNILLNSPNLSNRLRRKMLSLLFFRKQCRYFVAYDPAQKQFDRLIIKRRIRTRNDFLVVFDLRFNDYAHSVHTVIRKEELSGHFKLQALPTENNVRIETKQTIYTFLQQANSIIVVQNNSVNAFNSAVLSPVSWIVGMLISSKGFKLKKYRVELDSKSFVNYYVSSRGSILINYFAFIVISLMLLALLFYSSRIRRQRRALANENDKLESNMRRKAYIAELLGHEIKSPLHSLQQLLRCDKKSQSLIERIKRAILRFADVEAEISGLDGVVAEIELNDFLSGYCKNAQQYKSIGLLEFVPSSPKLNIITSAEDLEIVLDHIINNANDFRTANTMIIIRASRESDQIIITITNQGTPIPDDILPHLFEFGSSSRSHAKAENLGQGLFVACEKLKELNASIRAFNVENGVTFEIIFSMNRR